MKRIRCGALLAASLIAMGAQAQQTYPWKAIRLVSGVTPGSSSDTMARIVSEKLQAALGQPVIVENRLGAGGTIAAEYVARADPDGHTISVYTSAFTVAPFTTGPPWDPIKDFAPVATLASTPNILVTAPSRGFDSVQALVAAAKANPGKLTFASAGLGSSTHMGGEKFRAAAGIDVVHVPYKGAPEALADVIAGRVDYYFVPVVSALGQIRDGKLRALAVAAPKRIAALPDLPTTAEAGYPGAEYNFWVGMLVAAKTPRGTVERLNQEVNKVLQMPDVRERTEKLGGEVLMMPLPAFEAMIRQELADNEKLLKAAGIKRN
jgi:tripartite-type tricarboxylate transporter receptor subunit TctC